MKKMNKREFLRMLGLGGMASLAAPVLAKVRPSVPEVPVHVPHRLIYTRGHLCESGSSFAHPVPANGCTIEARFSNGAVQRMALPADLRAGDEVHLCTVPGGVRLESIATVSGNPTVSFGIGTRA